MKTEKQVNNITCEIIKLLDGTTIVQAEAILNYAAELLRECHVVDIDTAHVEAKLEELQGRGPSAA